MASRYPQKRAEVDRKKRRAADTTISCSYVSSVYNRLPTRKHVLTHSRNRRKKLERIGAIFSEGGVLVYRVHNVLNDLDVSPNRKVILYEYDYSCFPSLKAWSRQKSRVAGHTKLPDPSGILHSVMVATSAPEDVRMLMRANSLPPASNLHAFHVSSFMVLSPVFFSLQESSRGSCGTWSTSLGSSVPLVGLGEYPGGHGAYPPGGFDLLALEVPDLHNLNVLQLVQSEESVDCLASLEVVLGSGLWQWQWPWQGWREWLGG
jgi:hypothetical protein